MSKKKKFLIGLMLLALVLVGYGVGFFRARYNVVILTESKWDNMSRAEAQVIEFNAEAERQEMLKLME